MKYGLGRIRYQAQQVSPSRTFQVLLLPNLLLLSTMQPPPMKGSFNIGDIHVTAPTTWIDIGPLLLGRLSLQFSVKASNDAYFGLSSGNTAAFPGYWIILEGFSMDLNCIRDGFVTGTCYSQHIGSYLSPRESVRYWVQWDQGNIRVGIGEAVGSSKIMEHQFPNAYPISNVLLRNGQWIIYL